jgi:biopolymer transport protein ExbD
MAEVNSDSGGSDKKGRKKGGGNPRVDMTPMVDLAFLLLTFFVLTSNLNKAKTMEMAVPKDAPDTSQTTKVDDDLAHTILLDGNKEGIIYVYKGKFSDAPPLNELSLDPKADKNIRKYILEYNNKVSGEMKTLRNMFKTGKLTEADLNKLNAILAAKAVPDPKVDSIVNKRKKLAYDSAMVRLRNDQKAGAMSDTTFKFVGSNIKDDNLAPFIVIKWGGDAKYGDVINIIDELKIGDALKYALVKISRPELEALSGKTGRKYPELLTPAPPAETP